MRREDRLFAKIARGHLGIESLETRKSDSLDFHDLAVWRIKTALRAAYFAGIAEGRRGAFWPGRLKGGQE